MVAMRKSTPPPLPWNRLRTRILFWVFLAVGLVVIALLVALGTVRWGWHRDVKEQIARIKADGLPTTAEELELWHKPLEDSTNAAIFYEGLFEGLPTNTFKVISLSRNEPLTSVASNQLRVAVSKHADSLRLARRGTPLTSARYSIDLTDSVNTRLPHLARLKVMAQLLRYEAILNIAEEKPDAAAEAILATHRAARTLDEEPVLISALVVLAMDAIGFSNLERLLNHSALDTNQLAQLRQAAALADRTNRFVKGLIADRATHNELIGMAQYDVAGLQEIAHQDEEEQRPAPTRQPGLFWNLIGFFERDRAFYLHAMATNIQVHKLAPPESLHAAKKAEKVREQARRGYYIFSSLLLPALERLASRDAEASARARTALVALAVEDWRITHGGKTPDSLDDLVPAHLKQIPTDPFDGQPLRYKKLPHGYVVYSIGQNYQNDNGTEQPPKGTKLKAAERARFDITFTVER
jgi:hypothetical protein